jgi:glucan phosphorylase
MIKYIHLDESSGKFYGFQDRQNKFQNKIRKQYKTLLNVIISVLFDDISLFIKYLEKFHFYKRILLYLQKSYRDES